MRYLLPLFLLALVSCQPKANYLLDNCSEIRDLRTGELLTPRQAFKADGCYGCIQTDLFESRQTISFVRYRPEKFYTTVVASEREAADSTSALCLGAEALAGINGSYFNVDSLITTCFLKDDGNVIGETAPSEYDRTNAVLTLSETQFNIDECDTTAVFAGADACWEVMVSGPILIDEGQAVEYTQEMVPGRWKRFYIKRHPRSMVGREADGTTWLIVVDGRVKGEADGMTIAEITELSKMLGLRDAINLDGGGSSTLWTLQGGVLNHPVDNHQFDHFGQRQVPNVLIVR